MNTKLKCLLLDDELPALTYLRALCGEVEGLEVLRAYNRPEKFLEESPQLDYDLCILDIEMPGFSGLEIARSIAPRPVIFTTAYKNYAAEAFEIEAVDYLSKPIQKERLLKAIQKAARNITLNQEQGFIHINTNKGKGLLYFNQLLHITSSETDKRDKLAILRNGEEMVLKNISFDQLLSLLPAKRFCRVNKKDLIALDAVKFYRHDQIVMSHTREEMVLVLSDKYKKQFLERSQL